LKDYPLWTILDHQGRSIRWLARRAEVSEDLLLSVKSGRRRATDAFRMACARALDLPIGVLFGEPVGAVASADEDVA
jgi:hypothetical protein